MSEYSFYAFINRMRYIDRWGLMRNTQRENLQEHSMQVAVIAHALAVFRIVYFKDSGRPGVNPDRIAVMAMYHDASETITGDMPTPIKYANPEISKAYKEVEAVAFERLLRMLPEELREAYSSIINIKEDEKEYYKIIKAADRISAYIKCIEEKKAGNNEFIQAGEAILKTIGELNMPEADLFLKKYIPAYTLSLDELQG